MRKLSTYIAKSVVGAVGMVLIVIVGLDAIAALVDQLGELRGDYDFTEAMFYVALTLPSRLYEFLPFSALVGCLVGLGVLAGSSELVVMRAAGVSVAQISWAVMKPVLGFILLGAMLGEFVNPVTDQIAESRRAIAQGDTQALESKRGLWHREGNEFMHFNAVLPNGRLYGITRYQFDDEGRLLRSSFADTASYVGGSWRMEGVVSSRFEENRVITQTLNSEAWPVKLSPSLLNVLVLNPDALSINNLYFYANYLDSQHLESNVYWLSLWKKLLQPLITASLVIIAISFVFGPLREVTMGFRIFTGVVVGIVFRTSQDLLGPASLVFGFSPLLAVLLPAIVCSVIGFYLMRRAN